MRKSLAIKKLVALLLSVLMLLSFVGCSGGTSPAKDFEYEEVSGGLKITKYVGKSSVVVIPSVIDDKKVVSMSNSAFSGNVKLKEITLPDTFTDVSFGYFKNCEALEKIVYTGAITRIVGTNSAQLNDGLSTLTSFKSLEINSTTESSLLGLSTIINESDTLENIEVKEVTEPIDMDSTLGEDFGIRSIDREVNINMPQDIVDKYLAKKPYAIYEEYDLYYNTYEPGDKLEFWGYELCSELDSGKEFKMPDGAKNKVVSTLSKDYKIATSNLNFFKTGELEDEYAGVYLRASAKINGRSGTLIAAINYEDYEFLGANDWEVYLSDARFYEQIDDKAKMCLVFGVDKIKVNGVSYQVK